MGENIDVNHEHEQVDIDWDCRLQTRLGKEGYGSLFPTWQPLGVFMWRLDFGQ